MRRASDFRTKFIEDRGWLRGGPMMPADAQQGPKRSPTYRRFRPFSHRRPRLPLLLYLLSVPKCPSPPLLSLSHLNALLPDHLSASSSSDGGGKEERREGEAVAHLNGYPAYRLPCHVSLRRFLGRYNDADTHPEVVWGVVESARKRALPLGGEWVENYLSPAAADT